MLSKPEEVLVVNAVKDGELAQLLTDQMLLEGFAA